MCLYEYGFDWHYLLLTHNPLSGNHRHYTVGGGDAAAQWRAVTNEIAAGCSTCYESPSPQTRHLHMRQVCDKCQILCWGDVSLYKWILFSSIKRETWIFRLINRGKLQTSRPSSARILDHYYVPLLYRALTFSFLLLRVVSQIPVQSLG